MVERAVTRACDQLELALCTAASAYNIRGAWIEDGWLAQWKALRRWLATCEQRVTLLAIGNPTTRRIWISRAIHHLITSDEWTAAQLMSLQAEALLDIAARIAAEAALTPTGPQMARDALRFVTMPFFTAAQSCQSRASSTLQAFHDLQSLRDLQQHIRFVAVATPTGVLRMTTLLCPPIAPSEDADRDATSRQAVQRDAIPVLMPAQSLTPMPFTLSAVRTGTTDKTG